MRLRRAAATAIAVLGGVYAGWAYADISPIRTVRIGIGESVRPVHEAAVRMVSEEVNISLDDSTATVSCRFDLKNEGGAKTLPAGFPDWYFSGIYDFHAWVDGKEIPVKMVEPIPAHELNGREPLPFRALFTIPFGPDEETVTVRTRYKNRLAPDEHRGLKDLGFEYILRTGSYWKGLIADAKVTVDYGAIPAGRISAISPPGYTRTGHVISWRFRDFEPETPRDDIVVGIIRKELYSRMAEAYFLLRENPSSARGHYLLGTVLFNREDRDMRYKKAERELLRAVELDPGMLDARFLLAVIYRMRRDGFESGISNRSAASQLREILKKNPDYHFRDWRLQPEVLRIGGVRSTRASEWLERLAAGTGGVMTDTGKPQRDGR